MHFALSTIVALSLSLSVAIAAPATSNTKRQGGCPPDQIEVTLEGADPASDIHICVSPDGTYTPTNNNYLEISRIFYDTSDYYCTFTAEFDNCNCAAKAAYVYGDDVVTIGPPQLVSAITCNLQ